MTTHKCLFKDKECTSPVTKAELEEAFGKRQIIIRDEYETDAGNARRDDYLAVGLHKNWNESVTPNIEYVEVEDFKGGHYYTSEYFETTS